MAYAGCLCIPGSRVQQHFQYAALSRVLEGSHSIVQRIALLNYRLCIDKLRFHETQSCCKRSAAATHNLDLVDHYPRQVGLRHLSVGALEDNRATRPDQFQGTPESLRGAGTVHANLGFLAFTLRTIPAR